MERVLLLNAKDKMEGNPLKILLIEDDPISAELIQELLREAMWTRFEVEWVDRLAAGQQRLAKGDVELALVDLSLPDSRGFETFQRVHEQAPQTALIVLTGLEDEALATRTVQAGAQDYLVKTRVTGSMLARAMRYAMERKRIERALENERRLLRTLIDNLPDYIFVKGTDSKFILNNRSHVAILGADSQEQILNKTDFDIFPGEIASRYYADEQNVMRTGHPLVNYEEPACDRDGHRRWLLTTKVPLRDPSGSIVGLVGISRDITEIKQGERRLATQHAATLILSEASSLAESTPRILRAIGENLDWDVGAIWGVDRLANVLRCSEIWHSPTVKISDLENFSRRTTFGPGMGMLGRVWLCGQPVWVPDFTENGDAFFAPYLLQAGLHAAVGFPIVIDREVLGVLTFFGREVRQSDNETLQMFAGLGRQIGSFMKRKQAQSELRQNEERTRLIVETANDAFVETDPQGLITDWNRQAEQIFGWTRHEVIGQSIVQTIIPTKFRDAFLETLQRFLETGEGPMLHKRTETMALHRDGHQFPVELTVWPVQLADTFHFNAFVRDITERKRAEEALRAQNTEIQRDLQVAREFQEALLPHEYPEVPSEPGMDPFSLGFYHLYRPTFTVSGDFFDVTRLSDHRAGIFIADVMGHGARSALVTAILRTLWQDFAHQVDDPGKFLTVINQHFHDIIRRTTDFVFASAFYLIIDTEIGESAFASAGHPWPLIANRGTHKVEKLLHAAANKPALGLMRDTSYVSARRRIEADDVFLLFTDGIFEAVNGAGEEFGRDRLAHVIEQHLDQPVEELNGHIVSAVNRYTGSTALPDDICLVTVEVKGVPKTAPQEHAAAMPG